MGLLFDTQGDTYLVDTFHQLFVSAKLKKHSVFKVCIKHELKPHFYLIGHGNQKATLAGSTEFATIGFFLLIMPFTFLFNTFDVNGTGSFAIFGQKCHKKLNRLTGHSGRAISVNFTPNFIFCSILGQICHQKLRKSTVHTDYVRPRT